jgi:1,2-dihydroxy-3-keto-5-methylthiopentene dioxygenase
MAVLRIPDEELTLTDSEEVAQRLGSVGIDFEHWEPEHGVDALAPAEEILAAYSADIERLKETDGYATADVIDLEPATPNLDAMLDKFNKEHWHDEDEVRFVIDGRGLFHIRPEDGPVMALEVEAGDLVRVPRGTWHWFDLCGERRIRAIRLFQDAAGWTPRYTNAGTEKGYMPVCLGPQHIPIAAE